MESLNIFRVIIYSQFIRFWRNPRTNFLADVGQEVTCCEQSTDFLHLFASFLIVLREISVLVRVTRECLWSIYVQMFIFMLWTRENGHFDRQHQSWQHPSQLTKCRRSGWKWQLETGFSWGKFIIFCSKKFLHPPIFHTGGMFLEVKNFKNPNPKVVFHPNFFFKSHQFLVISLTEVSRGPIVCREECI